MKEPDRYILINGRHIKLKDILDDLFQPSTRFEQDIVLFCKEFSSEQENFTFSSSGSTGDPKPLIVNRKQILASIAMTASALDLQRENRSLLCIPVANTGGKMMLARALVLNLPLECVEPDSNPFLNISTVPDFVSVVPYQLSRIIATEETKNKLDQVQNVLVGGAPVDDYLVSQLKSVKAKVYSTYGMTETVSHVALQLLNTPERQEFYEALPGIEILTDEKDCLKIKGAVTNNSWVQTNDRVRLHHKNKFEWLGRADFVINSGGVKIQPEYLEKRIEKTLRENNINNHFFIYGIPHEKLGQQCVLVIEGSPLPTEKQEQILAILKNLLPPYQNPRNIKNIPKFSFTATGKFDRRKTAGQIML